MARGAGTHHCLSSQFARAQMKRMPQGQASELAGEGPHVVRKPQQRLPYECVDDVMPSVRTDDETAVGIQNTSRFVEVNVHRSAATAKCREKYPAAPDLFRAMNLSRHSIRACGEMRAGELLTSFTQLQPSTLGKFP